MVRRTSGPWNVHNPQEEERIREEALEMAAQSGGSTPDAFEVEDIRLGDFGKRLYGPEGQMFEAYEVGDADVRVYRMDDNWRAKIHLGGIRKRMAAFETMRAAADDINEAYDAALSLDEADFYNSTSGREVHDHINGFTFIRRFREAEAPFAIQYNMYPRVVDTIRGRDMPRSAEWGRKMYTYGTKAAVFPFSMGVAASAASILEYATGSPMTEMLAQGVLLTSAAVMLGEPVVNAVSSKPTVSRWFAQDAVDRTLEAYSLENDEFLNRLQSSHGTGTSEAQDGDALDAKWETLRRLQFEEFEKTEGVTVSMATDDYDAAREFVGTVTGREIRPLLPEDELRTA